MASFTANTLVVHPVTGEAVRFRAGDEVPDWAERVVTTPGLVEAPKPRRSPAAEKK